MKKKIVISILLILALLLGIYCIGSYIYTHRTATMTGEIVYVLHSKYDDPEYMYYNIYVKPLAKRENQDLILFEIREGCVIDDSISDILLSENSQLLVGTNVEITYYEESVVNHNLVKSIQPQNNNSPVGSEFYYDLVPDYKTNAQLGGVVLGEITYIAEMNIPEKGYLIYVEGNLSPLLLDELFIDEKTFGDDDFYELLSTGELVGRTVKCKTGTIVPFKSSGYLWVLDIELK